MQETFADANVTKIAVIDDDLTSTISKNDLRNADTSSYFDILEDNTDEDHTAYVELLKAKALPHEGLSNLINGLSNEDIRNDAPESLRDLAERAFEKRRLASAPVRNVIKWIEESGFPAASISNYDSFDAFKQNSKSYDLILVDYLLANDSEESTKALIRHCLAHDNEQVQPQIFILMSSYEEKLIENFQSLREEFCTTGSRFRILRKPTNDHTDKAEWLHTIDQVCQERSLVRTIEQFIKEWGEQFQDAVKVLSSGLWGLDAHGLDLLRRTANEDHTTFSAYFSELIMRRVLAEVESKSQPSVVASELDDKFSEFNSEHPISPGSEVSDSREYLRKLLGDATWHREEWYKARKYPISDDYHLARIHEVRREQYDWIRNNLSFGAILKNKKQEVFIHLTQTCDLAHLDFDERHDMHLLFFPGELKSADSSKTNNSEALSPGVFLDGKWNNILWNLHRPITPAFHKFQEIFEDMRIVGQLRSDQAQQITSKYAAKISRVGTLRMPTFTELKGYLIYLSKKEDEGEETKLEWNVREKAFKAHLLSYDEGRQKKHVVNFASEESAYLTNYFLDDEAAITETTRLMMRGISLSSNLQAKVFNTDKKASNELIVVDHPINKDKLYQDPHTYLIKFPSIEKLTKEANIDKTFMIMNKS